MYREKVWTSPLSNKLFFVFTLTLIPFFRTLSCLSFHPRLVWVWLLGFCYTLSCNYQQHLKVLSAGRNPLSLFSFFEAKMPVFSKIVLSHHYYAVVRVVKTRGSFLSLWRNQWIPWHWINCHNWCLQDRIQALRIFLLALPLWFPLSCSSSLYKQLW